MMTQKFGGSSTNQKTFLDHPVGLYVLFFTEMWERFSYYGMRAIFVLFLISSVSEGGFGWERSEALTWYAWYTSLVYFTPLVGGWIADRYLGYRYGVLIGALVMTLGHAVLAFEMLPTFVLGVALLIIGNGFFKPNITPIVGQMYPDGSPLKDGAYTIFYMGVNSGAFVGILICGWLGESAQFGWGWGFGCAGIFMLFGLLQFWFGQKIFGQIGLKPDKKKEKVREENFGEDKIDYTSGDKNFLALTGILFLGTICSSLYFDFENPFYNLVIAIPFVICLLLMLRQRLRKYPVIERERITVIAIFSFFVIFFWLAFEQAGGSMTIFAEDYTNRDLHSATSINVFRTVSLFLTFIPIVILSWVLISLAIRIVREYPLTILFTSFSFLLIWVIIVYINYQNFHEDTLEVPATWFSTLNAFFIISCAPLFSKMWEKLSGTKFNPSGPVKFAVGLFLLGLGFVALAYGAATIPQGAMTASVSMIWLVLAYFFHTMGELAISPVGLSYVNKLSPKRLVAFMFGVWYLANFVANFTGGIIGSYMDRISEATSLSRFFSIFVISSFVAGIIMLIMNKKLKKMMHGIN